MRRGLFILATILVAVSGQGAHAAKFGTKTSYQHLRDLTAKGPKGEALALGYETATHWFFLSYSMTGRYVLVVKGSGKDMFAGRDIYHVARSIKKAYRFVHCEKVDYRSERQRGGGLRPLP